MNAVHRLARLSSVFVLLFYSVLTFAQGPTPRISRPIETSPSVPLQGSLNPHVRLSDDLGPLPPDTPIRGVTLVFKRSAAQEADLQQLLAQQTDPSSPLFHHWLTPEDFAARFGIADSDIAATQSWLQAHGFTIDILSPSTHPDRITFSGTAAQIQQAFDAPLHRLRYDDELHFAPAAELSLPPTLAPLTGAVLHLSDFRPQPSLRIHPDFTTLSNQSHFLSPRDISEMYDAYDFLALSNSGNINQGLAVVGQSFVKSGTGSAIASFNAAMPNGSVAITPIIVPGSGNEAVQPGDVGESEIDLEYSSNIVHNASLFFVYTGSSSNYSVMDALVFAIVNDIAPVISISYGICEPLVSTAHLQQYNALFEQAAAQGQTIVASSGDSGSTACARYSSSSASATQQQELAVDFPASSPYVTAVGGTQMAPGTFAPGSSNYWAAATGSSDSITSLLSYVPEVAWNEDSTSAGILSSGGGLSSFYPRPAWQAGVPGIPSGSYRLVPDIALQASVSSPGYIICTDDPSILGTLADCTNGMKASNGAYVITGGTSFAAPIFAAMLVDLSQYEQSTGFGNINPILYSLAAQPPVYSSAFHDITSGTTACAIGEGNCAAPGTSAYAATAGYDLATGLGSLDFTRLAAAWPSVSTHGAVASYLQVSGIPQTATAGASSAVSLTVSVGCGLCTPPAPTGSVLVSVDGATAVTVPLTPPPSPAPLQASGTWNFVAPSSTGSHIIVFRYPGDAFHLPSSSTFAVLVGNVVPSGSFTLSANNLTLASNGAGSTQVTVTPSGYSGALTWSSSYTGGTLTQNLCYGILSRSINGPSTVTMSMGVGTACTAAPTGSRAPSPLQGPAQRSSLQPPSKPASRPAPIAAAFVALLLCGLLPSRRRRKLLPILSTLTLAILASTLAGCGGGSGGSGGGGGGGGSTAPQPQVYTITLRAADSVNPAITASTTFTLTINP